MMDKKKEFAINSCMFTWHNLVLIFDESEFNIGLFLIIVSPYDKLYETVKIWLSF